MKSWIHLSKGQVPRQARVGVGELNEDLLGRKGFFGRAAAASHRGGPGCRPRGQSALGLLSRNGQTRELGWFWRKISQTTLLSIVNR